MGKKVVGYIRVSMEGQVRDGYSLAYQVEEIERYCNENNLELLRVYEDRGISGATVDEDGLTVERESLQELLSDMAYQQVKHVIVLNTSRLWRSDMAKVLIQRELKKHAVDVKAIEQPNYSIYAHDPNDFLVNGMLELLDQYQRLEIALKLSRGRKKKAEQGGYAGGGVMFGYRVKKGQKDAYQYMKSVGEKWGKGTGNSKYTTKIKWGINDIEARPYEKGYWGKRIPQKNPRVDEFELKINPSDESFYLPIRQKT
ncbi:recombinase family protein [Bacillus cereus]